MKAQCLNETTLVMSSHNVTCNMKAVQVSVPFIILNNEASHLVDSHNLHMYLSMPRTVNFADEEIWHGFKNPLPSTDDRIGREDFGTFNLQSVDLTNPFQSFIIFSPFLICLLSLCCCCLVWKYPSCPKKVLGCGLECCKKGEEVVIAEERSKRSKTTYTIPDAPEGDFFPMQGGQPPMYREATKSGNVKYNNSQCIKESMYDSNSSSKLKSNVNPNDSLVATERAITKLGTKIDYNKK